jgi:hypothetical protein
VAKDTQAGGDITRNLKLRDVAARIVGSISDHAAVSTHFDE